MRMTFRYSFSAFIRARATSVALVMGVSLMLSGCAETELVSHLFKKATWAGSQETAGSYKVGNPYTVAGVRYHPREDFNMVETGIASWYGPNFHGKRTANGEKYDQNALTAAHRTLQMPSLVRVTNLENGLGFFNSFFLKLFLFLLFSNLFNLFLNLGNDLLLLYFLSFFLFWGCLFAL